MAIAKMKKITIIANQLKKEQILKSVQELQKMELIDLDTRTKQSEWLSSYEEDCFESEKDLVEKLSIIQQAQTYLRGYLPVKSGFKKLKEGRKSVSFNELERTVKKSSLVEICQEINQIETELRELDQLRKQKSEQELFLKKWQNLDFSPHEIRTFKHFLFKVGTVSIDSRLSLKQAVAQQKGSYLEEVYQTKDEFGFLLIIDPLEEEKVDEMLQKLHFSPLKYEDVLAPNELLIQVEKDISDMIQQQEKLRKKMKTYEDQLEFIQLGEEYYGNELQRMNARSLLLNGSQLVVLTGWLEETEYSDLEAYLLEDLPKDSFALVTEEVQEREMDQVPTVLKNNPLVEPFETLTEMYSLPKYNDVDPTPLLMPFYMVFFGMMVADVGYGLILLLATFFAQKMFNLEKGLRKNIRFFYLLSYPTIVWGIIYGSFFGYALPFHVLDPQKDVNTILITSVVFGFIQLIFGLCVNGTILLQKKKRMEGYIESFSWVGILGGIALLVLGILVLQQSMVTVVGLVLVGTNVVGLLVFSTLKGEKKLLGFGSGLYALYGITSYVGDLVSYTRLMALGIAGGSIAQAFNLIIDLLPPIGKFTIGILLFFLLHAINIFLSFLSAYVHGARLQYVEFFGKFYEGGGRALRPLKTVEKYIYLKKRTNKK